MMTDKGPADELAEVLQKHRQKMLQDPPMPAWEDQPEDPPSEPTEPQTPA